jgi:hypothetical protein
MYIVEAKVKRAGEEDASLIGMKESEKDKVLEKV